MSLAFALMAAINGSTGSSARLTYGLKGTKPHRRQPDGARILIAQRRRRKPSETLTFEQPAACRRRSGGGSPCMCATCKTCSPGSRRPE